MIERMTDLPEGTVGLTFSGRVSGQDYDTVLIPALERAIEENDRVKALFCFGEEFRGYELAAAWDDTLMALRHWRGFSRIAVVAGQPWLRTAVRAMGVLLPCPVRLFDASQLQEARLWLEESLGAIHLHEETGVVRAELIGRLEPSAYDRIEDDLAALFSRMESVRLLIDLRRFDGWADLSALADHLSLVREHRRVPRRVAVLGDARWQRTLQKILSRFSHAESRFFDAAHADQARAWISAPR
jgi:hypothetical protein